MDGDLLPQLSLGTAALLIFAVFAAYVLVRGLTRILVGVGIVCGSAWIGFQVWQVAPALAIEWTGEPTAWISTGLPLLAFFATLFLLRALARTIVRPFGEPDDEPKPKRRLAKIALAAIPAAIFCLTGGTLLHHVGAISELRASAGGDSAPDSFFQNLKGAIESALPDSWLSALDPLADSPRLSLAKLIAAKDAPLPAVDPETGEPIPRAIIVDEDELKELAREGRYSTLLRHPLLNQALENPEVREMLRHSGL